VNYLAHLVIAERYGDDAGYLAGSLLPDFVRGRLPRVVGPVARGVALHRWVDRLTDIDPIALRTRGRLRPTHGRFAGVLVDMLYDHCLARRFGDWSAVPYAAAIDRYHARLSAALPDIPPAGRPGLTRLIEASWMRRYADLDGMRCILWMMQTYLSQRFDREVRLEHAADTFVTHADAMQSDFDAFFTSLLNRADAAVQAGELFATPDPATPPPPSEVAA
jgi:acyl carrier protein phosphodiesterase